jgi:hypothetical protein
VCYGGAGFKLQPINHSLIAAKPPKISHARQKACEATERNVHMSDNSNDIRAKANTRFLDTQKKAADRKQASNEYESEAKAREAKTAKLKALRLAKEAEDRLVAALTPVAAKPKRASRAKAKV